MRQKSQEMSSFGCYVAFKAVDVGANGNIFYFTSFRVNKLILVIIRLILRENLVETEVIDTLRLHTLGLRYL